MMRSEAKRELDKEVLPLVPPKDLGCSDSCDRSGSSTVIISLVTSCRVRCVSLL